MQRNAKSDLSPVIQAGQPVVVVVLSTQGLEKSLVFYAEDDVDSLEAGTLLLAKISPHLLRLDNALRTGS